MPCVAHLMLVMVLNMPEQCSFQHLLFHLLLMPKYAEKSASRMDISLIVEKEYCKLVFLFFGYDIIYQVLGLRAYHCEQIELSS